MKRYRYPFNNVDWTDLKSVEALCAAMGDNCIVIKYRDRPNYNITHLSRTDRWDRDDIDVVSMPVTQANLDIISKLKPKERGHGWKKAKLHSARRATRRLTKATAT